MTSFAPRSRLSLLRSDEGHGGVSIKHRSLSYKPVRYKPLRIRLTRVLQTNIDVATTNDLAMVEASGAPATPNLPPSAAGQQLQTDAPPAASASKFVWTQHWWPVSPVDFLDTRKPTPVTLLGKDLVVWKNPEGTWQVMEDCCPHRLAPLSEGRLEGDQLVCSYHGWRFNDQGKCTTIPSIGDKEAHKNATQSRRTCVTTYPTQVKGGILFAWLDVTPQGLAASATQQPNLPPEMADDDAGGWTCNQLYNEWTFWLEQGMDPSHANFLHAGFGSFKPQDSIPMSAGLVKDVDLHKGFVWEHGGYEKKNEKMQATRKFTPPYTMTQTYVNPNGSATIFSTMAVPVKPGMSRVYFKFTGQSAAEREQAKAGKSVVVNGIEVVNTPAASTTGSTDKQVTSNVAASSAATNSSHTEASTSPSASSAVVDAPAAQQQQQQKEEQDAKKAKKGPAGAGGLLFGIFRRVPHWLFGQQLIADQDTVMMHKQEHYVRKNNVRQGTAYALMSMADEGVNAMNKWLRLADYDHMWQTLYRGNPPVPQERTLEELLDRQQRHVKHCVICQKGYQTVSNWIKTSLIFAFLFGVASAGMAGVVYVASQTTVGGIVLDRGSALLGPAIASGVLCVLCGLLYLNMRKLREERFVTGVKNWRKMGGLSLVKMP